jgi:hypothetical protein
VTTLILDLLIGIIPALACLLASVIGWWVGTQGSRETTRNAAKLETRLTQLAEGLASENKILRDHDGHWQERYYAERQARNELLAKYNALYMLAKTRLGPEAIAPNVLAPPMVPSREEQTALLDILIKHAPGICLSREWRDMLVGTLGSLAANVQRRESPRNDLQSIVYTAADWDPVAFRALLDTIVDSLNGSQAGDLVRAKRLEWGV